MKAVANVIGNRAKNKGQSYREVIEAPKQFSVLNNPKSPEYISMMSVNTKTQKGGKQFQTALDIANQLIAGTLQDTTGGADHYYNPSIATPYWASSLTNTTKIGRHQFLKSR